MALDTHADTECVAVAAEGFEEAEARADASSQHQVQWPAVAKVTRSGSGGGSVSAADAVGDEELPDPLEGAAVGGDVKRALLYATLLLPLTRMCAAPVKDKGKAAGRGEDLLFTMLSERLKRKHRDANDAIAVAAGAVALSTLVHAPDPLAVGLALRKTCQSLWPAALLLSAAAHLSVYLDASARTRTADGSARAPQVAAALLPAAHACLAAHLHLAQQITGAWRLDGCWAAKPLVTGTQAMALLGVRAGPALRCVLDAAVEWQLLHPAGTPAEAEAHLVAWRASPAGAAAVAAAAASGPAAGKPAKGAT